MTGQIMDIMYVVYARHDIHNSFFKAHEHISPTNALLVPNAHNDFITLASWIPILVDIEDFIIIIHYSKYGFKCSYSHKQ